MNTPKYEVPLPKKKVQKKPLVLSASGIRWDTQLSRILKKVINMHVDDFLSGKIVTPWKHSGETSHKKK